MAELADEVAPLQRSLSFYGSPSLFQKMAAEGIGTFTLVFAGCGAIMVDHKTGGTITHVGVAAVFGLVVMAMIYAVGHVSGAHFNPAVTVAFAVAKRFSWRKVPAYVTSQVLAALAASLALRLILGPAAHIGSTYPTGSDLQALALEAIMSFFLMFVIAAVATDDRAVGIMAGAAIGSTVALDALFGGPVTGASMNPARSIGPAVVALKLDSLWVYIVGPLLGTVTAAWTYHFIRCSEEEPKLAHGCCH